MTTTIAQQVLTLLRQNGPMSYKSIHQSLTSSATNPSSAPSLNYLKEKVMKQLRKNNVIRALPPSAIEQLQRVRDGSEDTAAAKSPAKNAKQLQLQNKGTWQFVAVERKARPQVQRKQVILRDLPRYEAAVEEQAAETAVKA